MIKKPAVNKHYLLLISGSMWSSVGVLLIWIAINWFHLLTSLQIIFAILIGAALAIAISWFGFITLAKKNARRILEYPEYVCVFAFQRWQMYLLIAVMMSMGIFMRTSSLFPKYLLVPVYIGIGLALFASSFSYYRIMYNEKKSRLISKPLS
ncbi:MAG: hypothetical protein D8M58_18305 [Calditrichaeota bacterium]|nr:MAG: hypothetical protein DWQ03_11535 [Calditrichota bacterium]MBL1207363.1 hypothetical protein [Calditrichota bacterium]NOG47195.1 hypothetical protein [Calditrichota bacterium]